jgi:hypothetical protein
MVDAIALGCWAARLDESSAEGTGKLGARGVV